MKRKLFILLILIANLLIITKGFCASNDFVNNFSTCTKSKYDDGKRIVLIMGWANRKCFYREVSTKTNLECAFKQLQLKEISNELKSKKYTSIENLESAKKYFNMEGVCKYERKLEDMIPNVSMP